MSARAAVALRFGSLALLAFLCFAPALRYDFVVTSDDWDYVVANPTVRAGLTADGLRWALSAHAANWHPLTWLSHMADAQLYGLHPAGHHLTSLLLHAANAALLGLALFDLTGRAGRSWMAAALFAVHPTRIESVVWVAERKDVLCAFFWILATWAYVRGVRSGGRWRLAPALVLFGLGLLAKPMIVTLPVLLLLLDAWPLRRLGSVRDLPRLVAEKVPFAALAAAAAGATVVAQRAAGAMQSLEVFPLAVRLGNVPLAYASYLRVLVWPRSLSAYYVHPGAALPWAAAAAAAAALTIATVLALRSSRPYLQAGWLWFLVSLLPVIGIVQVGEQARADRYTYFPFVGLFVALVWGAVDALDRFAPRPALAKAALGAVVVVALAAATQAELPYWRDARTLFDRALELDPDNVFALQNLGVALLYEGDATGALQRFDRALRLRPGYPFALRAAAQASRLAGNTAAAASYLERLVRATPQDPVAAAFLGDARIDTGDLPGALEAYARARRVAPGFTAAAYPYAIALLVDGQIEAGVEQLAAAAAGSPDRAEWRVQLSGARQLATGTAGPERRTLERILSEWHRRLAEGLQQKGRMAEAQRLGP